MKYILVVGDGMADMPIDALGGKTPLEFLAPENMAQVGGGALYRFRSCPEGRAGQRRGVPVPLWERRQTMLHGPFPAGSGRD